MYDEIDEFLHRIENGEDTYLNDVNCSDVKCDDYEIDEFLHRIENGEDTHLSDIL